MICRRYCTDITIVPSPLLPPLSHTLSASQTFLISCQRLIDKSRVTCVKWVPGSESLFLVSHSSGNMYLYNVEHTCGTTAPHYQLLKQGENYSVHTCKSKSTRNPLLKWTVGEGALNEFAFSPDGKFLACVSQDGFLRVFNFDAVELHGTMKSYFGGLLCVCWSPDGKYIVAGGEDDLVTVWSFLDCRVIARGHGHKSWVSVVAFDHYTTSVEESDPMEFSGSDEDFQDQMIHFGRDRANSTQSRLSKRNSTDSRPVSVTYRFGSVGQDTQLCLWDLTEDILFPHLPLSRTRTHTNVMNATSPPAGATIITNTSSNTTNGNMMLMHAATHTHKDTTQRDAQTQMQCFLFLSFLPPLLLPSHPFLPPLLPINFRLHKYPLLFSPLTPHLPPIVSLCSCSCPIYYLKSAFSPFSHSSPPILPFVVVFRPF